MRTIYHKLAKKSTVATVLVLFSLIPLVTSARVPNDAFYNLQKALWEQINAPGAWDYTVGSRKTVIAIIDTGADIWHADLASNAWSNPYEIPENGVDDDHNGYVDDTHGWNFVADNNDVRTPVSEADEDPESVRHGTIIAGIAGAAGNNEEGIAGMNWHVQIMPLIAVDSVGSGAFLNVTRAVDYAVENGAAVISMSLVGEVNDPMLKGALRRAYEKGVVIVVAAGNNRWWGKGNLGEFPVYPACYDNDAADNWIITVASLSSQDKLSDFSSYGACVDIAAPGEDIFSTERYAPVFGYPNEYGNGWYGTSFAVPFVAGTAGLIKSLHPEWNARQVIDSIINEGDVLGTGVASLKRLNAGRAVKLAAETISTPSDVYQYGFEGNAIYYTVNTSSVKKYIARIPDAKILSVGNADINLDRQSEAVVLIERSSYLYLRFLKQNGQFWKELAISLEKDWRAVDLAVFENSQEEGRIALRLYNTKLKESKFYEYNQNGKQLRSVTTAFNPQKWEIAGDHDILLYGGNDQLTIKRVKWYNQ